MRTSVYAASLAASVLGRAVTANPVQRTYYSQQMATSIMSRTQGIMTGTGGSSEALQAGVTQKILTVLSAQYPDYAGFAQAYIRDSAESAVRFLSNATNDVLVYPMDRLSNGNALINFDPSRVGSEFLNAADALRESIDLNRRNAEDGLWYFVYPYWSYLDGMFSLAPFYSAYALHMTQRNSPSYTAALDDMLEQMDLLWNHTINANGLLRHGYDDTRTAVWADPVTGSSPIVWGRSLGWYTMALADTIEILTSGHAPGKYVSSLLLKFRALMPAIMAAVDPNTGGWFQVVDQQGQAGNYIESSATSMFTYSLLKGARLGYLPRGSVSNEAVQIATRSYNYLVQNFVVDEGNGILGFNGTVSVCSLNSTANYDYYIHQPIQFNSVLGAGAFVLASSEYERLQAYLA